MGVETINLTDAQRVALANCEYDKITKVLKCQKKGCHKRIDFRFNENFCYWCWRDFVHSETKDEWREST